MSLSLVLVLMGCFAIVILVPLVPYVLSGEKALGIPKLSSTSKNYFRILFAGLGVILILAGIWVALT